MSDEIEILRAEVTELQKERRQQLAERQEERITARALPPLSQMTRIQKRYFLEPWYTTIMLSTWTLGSVLIGWGLWAGWRVILLGALFVLIGGLAGAAKAWHLDSNSKSEGLVINQEKPRKRGYYD